MPDPLTVGELRAIHAIITCRAPQQTRDRLAQRIEDQIRDEEEFCPVCTAGTESSQYHEQCIRPQEAPHA